MPAMESAFDGFPAETFAWFDGLGRDNSRTYFAATRERYEHDVRGALEALLDELAAELGGSARIFRQQRDLRFTTDKTPYKSRTYGVVVGANAASAPLYAELSSHGLYAGSGAYRLARDQLARYRAAVDDHATGGALAAAVAEARAAGLDVVGAGLTGAPRGYSREHPRIDLLRHTALIAGRRIAGGRGIVRDAALAHVRGTWTAVQSLTDWLAAHVGPTSEPAARRRPSGTSA
jgi:uncharacterized protein (TIGR02453 family)